MVFFISQGYVGSIALGLSSCGPGVPEHILPDSRASLSPRELMAYFQSITKRVGCHLLAHNDATRANQHVMFLCFWLELKKLTMETLLVSRRPEAEIHR